MADKKERAPKRSKEQQMVDKLMGRVDAFNEAVIESIALGLTSSISLVEMEDGSVQLAVKGIRLEKDFI